jgi:hypothetical protein
MTFDSSNRYRVHKYQWNPCSRLTGYTMNSTLKPGKLCWGWVRLMGVSLIKCSTALRLQLHGPPYRQNVKSPLMGLAQSTPYEWRVQSLCSLSPGKSAYSVLDTFATHLSNCWIRQRRILACCRFILYRHLVKSPFR